MIRTALFAGAAALCFAPVAQADHEYGYGSGYQTQNTQVQSGCERERDDNRLVGGIIGGVAGAALGVAIADDDDHYHRRRGYRGKRGYRGYRGQRGYRHNSDGDEIAGALIGGLLGAVVGSEIAGSNTDCRTVASRSHYRDLNVAPPTRQAFGSSQAYNVNASPNYSYTPNTQPVYETDDETLYGAPATPPEQPIRITRSPGQAAPLYGAQCQTVQRETRLPDGAVVREPVRVCQGTDGKWQMQGAEAAY